VSNTRSYSSPLREADAAATRARIVDAAGRLFVRDGYAATPLRAIAQEAGVSVQSVHLAGPKSALLIAAFERTFAGDEGRHPLYERPALAAIIAEPDAQKAIGLYVDFIAEANERSAGIVRAMHAAAHADPVARDAAADLDARRRNDVGHGASLFASRGLIPDSAAAEFADVLGFLTAPETYLYFVEGSGWSTEAYRQWLVQGLRDLLRPERWQSAS
jgi:AcrR family transcriptional regulator